MFCFVCLFVCLCLCRHTCAPASKARKTKDEVKTGGKKAKKNENNKYAAATIGIVSNKVFY